MALSKTGYRDAKRGITKANVNINSDGNIALDDDVPAGVKTLSIRAANADNSLADNTALFKVFVDMIGGSHDTSSNKMTVTWEAGS